MLEHVESTELHKALDADGIKAVKTEIESNNEITGGLSLGKP